MPTHTLSSAFPALLQKYIDDENVEDTLFIEPELNKKKAKKKEQRKKTPTLRAPNRERTDELLRKHKEQLYEQNYKDWQLMKRHYREEQLEELQSRIKLQQQLIAKQERLSILKRQNKERLLNKKRKEEKAAINSKNRELEEICKQSLDRDRQKGVEKRADEKNRRIEAKRQVKNVKDEELRLSAASERQRSRLSNEGHDFKESQMEVKMLSNLGSKEDSTMSKHKSQALEELEEEDEEIFSGSEPEEADVTPWYHEQLYQLYGKEADYFLYPKMDGNEKSKRSAASKTSSRLLKKIGKENAGAGELWTSLRNESHVKLRDQDKAIDEDLKAAYNAFVRQSLGRKHKPVRRNFSSSDDVPEMDRLQDQTRIQNAQDFAHKVELMFRASHSNEDRTRVLLHNNPLPMMNAINSVSHYLPSWIADLQDNPSEDSPQYVKWLPPSSNAIEHARSTSRLEDSPKQASGEMSHSKMTNAENDETSMHYVPPLPASNDWDFLELSRPKAKKEPSVVFLTEEGSKCRGRFSKKQQNTIDMPKAQSARGPVLHRESETVLGLHPEPSHSDRSIVERSVGESAARSQSVTTHRYPAHWEPLSMAALQEYRQDVPAVGQGDYGQGRPSLWVNTSAK